MAVLTLLRRGAVGDGTTRSLCGYWSALAEESDCLSATMRPLVFPYFQSHVGSVCGGRPLLWGGLVAWWLGDLGISAGGAGGTGANLAT